MSKRRRSGGKGAALQAAISLAAVLPAAAQPAPNASPQGGRVVAGSATITAGATATTIDQASNRAAINWRSFDVGSNQSVVFNQPGASSVTLNRVTGPDPSAIAGRISANGQLVITNPSGVVFHAGAQVNAQSVIVSAAGISNRNFMAGRMVFDRPASPNARIENAGTITVKEAGLAALVAPSVANSGTITARLGHVVLAGAATHTLDMYGDGLVSIDVTKQVTQAPVGPGGKSVTALVTNTGTIAADGGTVQLTARAVDGVVNTLVEAGGRIRANTTAGRAGQIEIAGTGGSVVIEGRVAADGRAPGTAGGSVAVAGSDATIVAPTARVSASGRAGGGTVAVGTTLARARGTGPAPAGTSQRTVVTAGARISADATATGDGGRVTVLSTQSTTMAGAITARGGPSGGNGGMIELSGETGFRLTGTADTSAPHGTLGTVVLDPRDLTITDTANGTANQTPAATDPNIPAAAGGTTTDAYVTPAQIEALTGNIRLQATRDLVVASNVSLGGDTGNGGAGNLTLEAGRNLTVNSGVTITVPGYLVESGSVPGILTLSAGTSTIAGYDPSGTLTVNGTLQASGLVLKAGTGGIVLTGALSTNISAGPTNPVNATSLSTTGSVVQTTGSLITNSLSGTAASIALVATGNQISSIGSSAPLTATQGGVTITTGTPLTVTAGASSPGIVAAAGATISLLADDLTLQPGGTGVPALSAPGGVVALQPYSNGRDIDLTSSATKPPGALALTTAETGLINASTLQFFGPTSDITFGSQGDAPVDLVAHGNFSQVLLDTGGVVTQNAALVVNSLSNAGSPVPLSNVTLDNAGNSIPAIGTLTVSGGIDLNTSGPLTISGAVSANSTLALASSGNMTVLASATVSGPNGLNLTVDNGGSGSLTVAGTVTSDRGIAFTAGTGGIALSGTITPGQALQIASAGPLTQTTGSIVGGTLAGSATSVSLASPTNSLDAVNDFTVTAGDFLLVNSAPLQVYSDSAQAGVALPAGGTATFVTDYLSLVSGGNDGGPTGLAVDAAGGTLVVAPYTANGAVLLTSADKPTSGLSLTTAELALTNVSALQLGSGANAGAITVGQAGDASIDLGALGITRLSFSASGAVTQNAALGVTTLAGTAGSLALADAGNFITELNGFTTTAGDLALHTSSGLTVSAALRANGGAGNLTLSSEQAVTGQTNDVALLLAGDVAGGTVRFDTTDGNGTAHGIDQVAGIVSAGTLTGVSAAARLPQANQISNLGTFTAQGDLLLTDARALVVSGAVNATGAVTLNARGITQTATSSITAAELDGSSSADTVLDSRANAIPAIGAFSQTAGNLTLVTSSPELDFGGSTGQVTAASGSLTFVADQIGLVARPASGTSVSAQAGLITFAPFTAGRPITVVDTNLTGAANALTLPSSLRAYLHADTLALGRAGYTGTITLGGPNEALDLTSFRALQVQTSGLVTQGAGSTLTVSSLTGTGGSILLPASVPGNNNVTSLGLGVGGEAVGLTATAGALTIGTIANLTTYGPISATTSLTLSTGGASGLTVAGSLSAPTITLLVGGALAQSASSPGITADTLAITAGSAALPGAGNRFGTLIASVAGDLTLADSIGLSISSGSTVAGTLGLTVAGAVTGGPLGAQALTGSATSLSLTASGNRIGALGPFATTAGFTLADAISLTVGGAVSDPASIALNVTGDLFLVGSLSAGQGVVTLTATGSIGQSGGAITTGSLTGSAGGSASLGQAGNSVATLAGFTTGGDFTLADQRSLVVSAPVDPNTVSMTVRGDLRLDSSVTGGTVALDVTGAIVEGPGGRIVADTLTSRAASASLNGSNQIAALGAATTTNGFSLVDAGALRVDGPVRDGRSIAISAAGPITLAGDVSAPAVTLAAAGDITQIGGALTASGTLAVSATGAFAQSGGTLAAGILSGAADSIDLGRAGSAAIGEIAGLAATGQSPGTLSVVDNAPLRLSGTLSGRYVSVVSTGSMLLADGVVIRTDGQPSATQLGAADAVPGSNLSVRPGAGGRATFTQAGTATVTPLTTRVATLRIDLPPSGGAITLNDLQAGSTDLVLNLGSGTATGTLAAGNLTVLGSSGQATLSGTVRGLSGDAAAQGSALLPRLDLNYTLNGCAISIASCSTPIPAPITTIDPLDVPSIFQPGTIIASAIASVLRPDILALDVLDLSVTRDRDDPTLLLPNISDKDY